MRNIWKLGSRIGILHLVAIAVFACGGGGGGRSFNQPRLAYLNGSPDAGNLTFTIDSQERTTGLAYPTASPLDEIAAGGYDLAVHQDGDNPDLDALAASLENEKEYLVSAVGLMNFGGEFFKRLRLTIFEINLTPPNGNRSRIYFVHGFVRDTGFDTPNLDLRNPGETPQYKIENVAFGSVGTTDIDSSTQTFVARVNGSDVVFATATGTFDPGGIYVALVSGQENGVGAMAPALTFIKIA